MLKVMVAAKKLIRNYLPEKVNDKFDVDKIYDVIEKYIEK